MSGWMATIGDRCTVLIDFKYYRATLILNYFR